MSKGLVVVTGVSQGLGLSVTRRLLNDGYRVVGISRKQPDELKDLESSFKDKVFFYSYDFNDLEVGDLIKCYQEVAVKKKL